MNMNEIFVFNEDIKKSGFTVMMLESMGWKLVESREFSLCGDDCEGVSAERTSKYVSLAFRRDTSTKSILFW